MVQTAEGALSEVVNMLQRIRELAVQSANGTNSIQNRLDLQLEVDQLLLQIDQVATNTEFNGLRPLLIACLRAVTRPLGSLGGVQVNHVLLTEPLLFCR